MLAATLSMLMSHKTYTTVEDKKPDFYFGTPMAKMIVKQPVVDHSNGDGAVHVRDCK